MAGLPFTQLPATSPEETIQREIQAGRKRIQDKFDLQWRTINANARTLGREKHQQMLSELHAKGKQEMLQFNQQAQQQLTQLQTVDQIAASGGMPEAKAEELKVGMVHGPDVAKAMYPSERSIPQQFGELDLYSDRLQDRLSYFKKEGVPKAPKVSLALGPLIAGISTARYAIKARKAGKVKIWDDSVPGKERYRDVTEDEKAEYALLVNEQARVKKLKSELLGRSDVKQRTVQPGEQGGTFGDKVTKSYKKQLTATELRKQGTREAYDTGKKLGYWQ